MNLLYYDNTLWYEFACTHFWAVSGKGTNIEARALQEDGRALPKNEHLIVGRGGSGVGAAPPPSDMTSLALCSALFSDAYEFPHASRALHTNRLLVCPLWGSCRHITPHLGSYITRSTKP